MGRVLFTICALVVLSQCTPRPHAGESVDELISGLALEPNDLVVGAGEGIKANTERTKEIVSRGAGAIPKLRAALLNPSPMVAGYSAYCLKMLKARKCRTEAVAAFKHWQAREHSNDNYFAMIMISDFISTMEEKEP